MNHSPNSISKVHPISLRQLQYPGQDFENYYLPVAEVQQIFDQGKLPEIKIADLKETGPRIALILALEKHPDRAEPDYSMHPNYVEAVIKAGGYPLFIAYDKVKEQLEHLQPDGILLIGGDFAFPPEWFEVPPAHQPEVSKRALAYLAMTDYAKEHKLPTLGICAGEQILGGYFGGMLKHSINKNVAEENNHRRGGYVIAHHVNIEKDSLLYRIIGKERIMVNTAHHEAVRDDKCGQFKITACADDGIVEAIEPTNPWTNFVLGVQWHPEYLVKLGDGDAFKIFETFIKEATNAK